MLSPLEPFPPAPQVHAELTYTIGGAYAIVIDPLPLVTLILQPAVNVVLVKVLPVVLPINISPSPKQEVCPVPPFAIGKVPETSFAIRTVKVLFARLIVLLVTVAVFDAVKISPTMVVNVVIIEILS